MPAARPEQLSRVATVEDWDDEADQVRPGTRTTAAVTSRRSSSTRPDRPPQSQTYKHVDVDSGYSSKAPTISSMNSSRQRGLSLRTDAVGMERGKESSVRHAPDLRNADRFLERSSKTKQFCHEQGICWVCDKYGSHLDPAVLEEKKRKDNNTAHVSLPPSATVTRTVVPRMEREELVRPAASRRMSSNRGARPQSMYVGTPPQQSYTHYPVVAQGWMAAPSPTAQQPVTYSSYYPAPVISFDHYVPQRTTNYEMPGAYDQRAQRVSGSSHERPVLGKMRARTSTVVEQGSSHRKQPAVVSHRPSRSVDVDRAMMPPPPRPNLTSAATARPRPDRAATYHSNIVGSRNSQYYDEIDGDQEDDEAVDCFEDEDFLEHRVPTVNKQTPVLSSRVPPTAYRRKVVQDTMERPSIQQKSRSYTSGSKHIEVASAPTSRGGGASGSMPRRRTIDSVQLDQREANIEAYLRKRGSIPSTDLTVENLKRASRGIDTHSEAGSTASHHTHQSSSRGSAVGSGSGRGRGFSSTSGPDPKHANTNMNININGLSLSIANDCRDTGLQQPVTIDLGGVQITMGANRDKEDIDLRREDRRIERAPSTSSNPSRRSLTSTREQIAAEIAARESKRRSGYITEEEAEAAVGIEYGHREAVRKSNKSSRQASRNPSTTRYNDADTYRDRDRFDARTNSHGSVDFTIRNK